MSTPTEKPGLALYSIGHSNHDLDHFLRLLTQHEIEVLVDVRSSPYSQFAPQYNREELRRSIQASNRKYLFFGEELGGRPRREDFYDDDGRVLYNRVAESDEFLSGIHRVVHGASRFRVALMCSEENPLHCHRRLLVGRVLRSKGIRIDHIRGDGRIQSEVEVAQSERKAVETPSLFGAIEEPEEEEWKSIRSVLRRRTPASSSDFSGGPESDDFSMSD